MRSTLFFLSIFITFSFSAAVLNFNDEEYSNFEADRYDWEDHPCKRPCVAGQKPKVCEYVFVVEQFHSMSKACYDCPFNKTDCSRPHCIPADGTPKMLYTVNRQMPGPLIEVCVNDEVIVDVRNRMMSESTTIHWHGLAQMGTPFMDGVPYVTQCPILPGQSFQYKYKTDDAGTYWWHSHIGSQRADGYIGALVVKTPLSKDPHSALYDFDDHRMIVTDWSLEGGDRGFYREFHYKTDVLPDTILINGLGPFQKYEVNGTTAFTPHSVFEVEQGKRYRFRMIDAGADNCPIEMAIDNHTMLIISLDSNDISPIEVDAVTIWPGERIDFILNAKNKVDNYWIRYRGRGLCEVDPNNKVHQTAILRYKGAEIENPEGSVGFDLPVATNQTRVLNPYNLGQEANQRINISIPDLDSMVADDICLTQKKADEQVFLSFDFYPLDNYDYHRENIYGFNQVPADRQIGSLQLNHISNKMPSFPLLTEYELIKANTLCNWNTINQTKCTQEQCACTHVIPLKLNSVVELVFVDEGKFGVINHPLHLHGHFFRVVATENLEGDVTVDRIKQLDKEGKIDRRLHKAPWKDTIKAPGGGYTIVRFLANNPGYWFFHCHFEQHMNIGMSLIFKVGEHKDFAAIPKDFPKCGSHTQSSNSNKPNIIDKIKDKIDDKIDKVWGVVNKWTDILVG